MNIVEFIKHHLIEEFRLIQQEQGHHYLSFGLISQGIEFLGSLTDKHDFNTEVKGASTARFNSALKDFFPKSYLPFADSSGQYSLYKNLRCGMLHIIIPTSQLVLGERKNEGGKYEHLSLCSDENGKKRLFLMSEEFYEDFRCACKKVIDLIDNQSIFVKYPELGNSGNSKQKIIKLEIDFLNTDMKLS